MSAMSFCAEAACLRSVAMSGPVDAGADFDALFFVPEVLEAYVPEPPEYEPPTEPVPELAGAAACCVSRAAASRSITPL